LNNRGKYVTKELKSESVSVFQSVEAYGNPTLCAILCSQLYDSKRGYVCVAGDCRNYQYCILKSYLAHHAQFMGKGKRQNAEN